MGTGSPDLVIGIDIAGGVGTERGMPFSLPPECLDRVNLFGRRCEVLTEKLGHMLQLLSDNLTGLMLSDRAKVTGVELHHVLMQAPAHLFS